MQSCNFFYAGDTFCRCKMRQRGAFYYIANSIKARHIGFVKFIDNDCTLISFNLEFFQTDKQTGEPKGIIELKLDDG